MCFSASASFGAGILLSAVGVASLTKVHDKAEILFAAIPLVFGVQQISEGLLWLSFSGYLSLSLQAPATFIFLFFAQSVWPLMVPLSILKFEKNIKRKKIERVLTFIGAVVAVYLTYCLINFHVQATVVGQHISYRQDYPVNLGRFGGILYLLATLLPPFISGIKKMWALGSAILISYFLTVIFYEEYVISVWCFFASVISLVVLFIMYTVEKTPRPNLQEARLSI
ncbi:MAG: hypothetical protein PSX36_09765 [bacterium]|nr:hypothetical protein [bacterium]